MTKPTLAFILASLALAGCGADESELAELRAENAELRDRVAEAFAGSRPVSCAQRSTLLQRQTDERPSLPSGFGKPGLLASTLTRCGEIPSRLAMSTAITSSVRESISTSGKVAVGCCFEST